MMQVFIMRHLHVISVNIFILCFLLSTRIPVESYVPTDLLMLFLVSILNYLAAGCEKGLPPKTKASALLINCGLVILGTRLMLYSFDRYGAYFLAAGIVPLVFSTLLNRLSRIEKAMTEGGIAK